MKKRQIALNTESVLDYLNSDSRIRIALKAAKDAGYEAVELWHVMTPENNASWKPFLDEAGLACAALHELYEEVIEDPERIIAKAKSRTSWAGDAAEMESGCCTITTIRSSCIRQARSRWIFSSKRPHPISSEAS